jgi:glycosyltransferase involved in cell wall biosynthesis
MAQKIKILHFSTHYENCGIGKYQEMFLEAMQDSEIVENKFFDVSPNQIRIMGSAEKAATYKALKDELQNYDILHVQHEFSFYPSDEFALACDVAHQTGKKLMVTVHTSPAVAYNLPRRQGLSLRSIVHYMRERKKAAFFSRTFAAPLASADLVLVHNTITKNALIERGVPAGSISHITIPVPEVNFSTESTEIATKLQRKPEDVIYATTGFLHQYKGIDHAIKTLSYLPVNYKLAIIGGMHQDHDNQIYNDLCDLIRDLGLMDRIYITGYVAEDDRLNALIREADICIYPYEKNYYSNVSSAALNNAFANHKPVIAYPTASFQELNAEHQYMKLTQAFSYYELARELQRIDIVAATVASNDFIKKYSYHVIAHVLTEYYQQLAA